jgi:hypothetical protein
MTIGTLNSFLVWVQVAALAKSVSPSVINPGSRNKTYYIIGVQSRKCCLKLSLYYTFVNMTIYMKFRLDSILDGEEEIFASSSDHVAKRGPNIVAIPQRRSMSDQDVNVIRDLIPFLLENCSPLSH